MDQQANTFRRRGLDKAVKRRAPDLPSLETAAWFKKLPAKGKFSPADGWTRDLTEDGDVESQPGPRVRHSLRKGLKFLSVNINGKENLHDVKDQFLDTQADVICIQETHMSFDEGCSFGASLFKQGWICFHVPQSPGGTMTLVSKRFKSHQVFHLSEKGGQALMVQVGPVLVMNMYAAHHADRTLFLQHVFENLQPTITLPWVVVGDFNDEPQESPLALALRAADFHLLKPPEGISSRWDGHRVIDYAFTSCRPTALVLQMLTERWSDHRGFLFQLDTDETLQILDRQEVVPCNIYLPKFEDDVTEWTRILGQAWVQMQPTWQAFTQSWQHRVQSCPSHDENRQTLADELWHDFNHMMETFLSQTAVVAQTKGIAMRPHRKPQRRKGTAPRVRRVPMVIQRAYRAAPNQLRNLQNLYGRLSEAERHSLHDHQGHDTAQLWKRISRHPAYTPGLTAKWMLNSSCPLFDASCNRTVSETGVAAYNQTTKRSSVGFGPKRILILTISSMMS